MSKKILNNVVSIIWGKGLDLLLNFITVTLIAKFLGVSNYGNFTSLVATVFILSKLIDFGFAQIVFREFSGDSKNFNILNNAISLRSIFFIVVILLYNILAYYFEFDGEELLYTNILFLGVILSAKYQNFRELLEIPFKSNLKMNYVMVFNILDNVFVLTLIILLFFINLSLLNIVIVYTLANLPGFLLFIFYLFKEFNYKFKFQLNKVHWLINQSLPLFGAVLLFALFNQLDVILIKNFVSNYEAGLYSVAVRLAMPLGIIPFALITTAFPFIAKNKNLKFNNTTITIQIVFKVLFLFSFLAGIFASFKAEDMIVLIFGVKYRDAAIPTIIIFWSYLFIFFSNFIQNILTIYDQQKKNFNYSLLLVVANLIIMFFVLISLRSTGAAFAKLFASLVGYLYLLYVIRKLNLYTNAVSFNTLIWSILIVSTSYILKDFNLIVFVLLFPILSIIFTFFTKYFTKDEVLAIKKLMNNPAWFPQFLIR